MFCEWKNLLKYTVILRCLSPSIEDLVQVFDNKTQMLIILKKSYEILTCLLCWIPNVIQQGWTLLVFFFLVSLAAL